MGMRRCVNALPILLLAVDLPSEMGGSVWKRSRPFKGHGSSFSLVEAHSVSLSLLRLHSLLASTSLLLAPLPLRPIPQFQNRYYDMILSTKLAGLGHAAFLFMSTARDRVSYVYPNVNSAGAGLLLSETFVPKSTNLSEGGYNMYHQMIDWLGRPGRSVPRHPVPPLKVSISRKLKAYVEAKYKSAGAEKGKYVVIHGIESDSKASMQCRGDADSLLPIHVWAQIAEGIRGVRPIFVIPHEKERENVEEIVGDDASIVFITTPGQLAALINDSVGVIATNTVAIQLANSREKPSIALFCSAEKGELFIPNAEEKKCTVVSSNTGKLADIDVEAVKSAIKIFERPLALV